MKLNHFVIVLCLLTTKLAIGQLAGIPQTETETTYFHDMGVRTAKQTWWFFRSKLNQKTSPNYSFHRIFLESYPCWLKDISYDTTKRKWWGVIDTSLPFDPSLDLTTRIFFDSVEIDDWIVVESNTLIGGFTLRQLETKQFKPFLKACGCYESNSAVNADFVSASKELFPARSEKDTSFKQLMDSIYIGGYDAFLKRISENLEFTEYALRLRIEGAVHISFSINNLGELTSMKVLRGVGAGLSDNAKKSVQSACEHFRKNRTDHNSHSFIQNVIYDGLLNE